MNGELPSRWERVQLGQICLPRAGKVIPASDDDRPYLSLDNIAGDSGTVIGWEKSSDYSSQSVELYPEDVAYARLRPYLNKVAHIDCEALGSAELIVLPKSQAILPRYLQHSLLSPSFCAFAQHESTGDRPRLKWRQMQEYEIALPPIDEQARIVAAIEEHFSRLDAAAESLRASHGKLRSLPSVLAKTAIRGWASEQLGEVAEVFVGSTPSRSRPELWDGSIPWVSSGEVQFCRIRETRESVSVGAVKSDRIHPPGTVLLGMIGEGKTRGQAAILEIAAAHNQNSAAIRVDHSRLMPEWLYYVFRAQYEANRGVGSGNNQPALNKSRVRELVVPLPPLSEQDRLIKGLNEAMDAIDHADAEVQRAQQRCSALYKSLLSEAFSGRLVPQDPNDEPASALLERIADSR